MGGFAAGLAAGAATLMRPSWLLFTPFAVALGIGGMSIANQTESPRGPTATGRNTDKSANSRIPSALWHRVLDAPRARRGDAPLVDSERLRHRPLRSHHAPGRRQPVRRPESRRYRGQQHGFREAIRRGRAPSREAVTARRDQESLEMRLDRRMRDDALAWARANPGRAVQLAGIKFLRMWNVWPNEPALAGQLVCSVWRCFSHILRCSFLP